MSDYKKLIIELNYSLFTTMAGSVLVRDDGVIAVNPLNPDHHQANLFYRIKLADVKDLGRLVKETNDIFNNVSCVPRFYLDENSTPSFDSLYDEFKNLGFENIELSNDSILSWSMQQQENLKETSAMSIRKDPGGCRSATIDDIDEITDLIAFAFGFHVRNYDWLRYTIKRKLRMPDSFRIFVITTTSGDREVIGSVTILHTPPGLPHLGYVNSVGTHPDHQRKGLAK